LQSLYDDSVSLFLIIQSVRELEELDTGQPRQDRDAAYGYTEVILASLRANLAAVQKTVEELVYVGHRQADLVRLDYNTNTSIVRQTSDPSVIDTRFGDAIRPTPSILGTKDGQRDDVVDMEVACRQFSKWQGIGDPAYDSASYQNMPKGLEYTSHAAGPSATGDLVSAADEAAGYPDSPAEIRGGRGSPMSDDQRESIAFIWSPY
jgi:hypothetical protein